MSINGMDHYAIRTTDMEPTREFYEQVLGFSAGPRPPFKFDGYWLYCGDVPVVHLVTPRGIKPGDDTGPTGAVDHIAFRASDLDAMRKRLEEHDVSYEERTVPKLELHQVFFQDPNGIKIEINFPPQA